MTKALIDARAEAQRIVAEQKRHSSRSGCRPSQSRREDRSQSSRRRKGIAEIRANALDSVKVVAKDTAKEIVAAMGGKADAKTITAAVTARMKG